MPRSEKSYYAKGALLRRIIALVGGGAKALQYFIFGPEVSFPGNCYSDSPPGGSINSPPGTLLMDQIHQQQQAHEMIGAAESVLWEARPVPARVAILKDRSSSLWDPSGTAKWPNLTEYTMGYRAETYVSNFRSCPSVAGSRLHAEEPLPAASPHSHQNSNLALNLPQGLFLAISVHGSCSVDFVSEDTLLNSTALSAYSALLITEPNIPSRCFPVLTEWTQAGGSLVLMAGAAQYDEYNTSTDDALARLSGCLSDPMPRLYLKPLAQLPGPIALPVAAPAVAVAVAAESPPVFAAHGTRSYFTEIGAQSTVLATFSNASINQACLEVLQTLCGGAKRASVGNCLVCSGAHQTPLKNVGCDEHTIEMFCAAGKVHDTTVPDSVAAVQTPVGSGKLVQLAFQPGVSYLINATQEYEIADPYTQFPAGVRALLLSIIKGSEPTADYAPPATVVLDSQPTTVVVGVETVLSVGPGGPVLSLNNWGGVPLGSDITVTINLPKGAASATSLEARATQVVSAATRQVLDCTAAILAAGSAGGSLTCQVPGFQYADFIVIAASTRTRTRTLKTDEEMD